MLRVLVFIIMVFSSVLAKADNDKQPCKYGTYKQMMSGECECTKHFPRKEIPKSVPMQKGHRLVSVCSVVNNVPNVEDYYFGGTFNFETDVLVDGVVDYTPGPAGDFFFVVGKDSLNGAWKTHTMFIESENSIIKEEAKLKAPANPNRIDPNRNICASAKAKLRVRKYSVVYAGDTDATGVHIHNYDLVKVGKYKVCPTETY